MVNISEKDKRIWEFYISNLNDLKKPYTNNKINFKSSTKINKVLKSNQRLVLDDKIKKKLYSKKLSFDAIIDLHGKTEFQAYEMIKNFVTNSFLNEFKNIIIITGKGINSQGKLKLKTPLWLKSEELSKYVVGFDNMPQNKGGEGALFVKLKNKSKYKL